METVNTIAENLMEMPFFVGAIFFFVALVLYQFPPKKINSFYGYRTPNSMKNQERWDFAQKFSSLRMIEGGLFLVLISFLKLAFSLSVDFELGLSLGFVVLVVVYLIVSTEKALKKNFPNQ
ncbi:SdpI family protein [Flavobacterium sp. RSB2_4_14]|uniref:SdpI family protein n=1 Tax=Flavobacterium sp. RSB2_4_14 TaxID=3447665 RepID=UPI003F383642